MYTTNCFLIECLTNLHAGSGNTSYGIIDKLVQRDPVTNLPCIFASSLKGALREYFEKGPYKEKLSSLAPYIFGKRVDEEQDDIDNSKGNVIFHEAQLIGIPVRSNMKPFFIATSKFILQQWNNKNMLFELVNKGLHEEIERLPDIESGSPKIIGTSIPSLLIEDFENVGSIDAKAAGIFKYLGKDIVLMHHDDLNDICSDYSLPVIARNNLVNGESTNLWYEQVVPHQSRFVFYTLHLGDDKFSSEIHNQVIQIGANSSLGYGYCRISKIF